MKILRFTLSGKQAFYKKPDVNSYYYFSYGQIHKVALLGLFGAILGYRGYSAMAEDKKAKLPEFYEKLMDVKVSVIPCAEKGNFSKKIISFNNSVGYASREQGGNLIVKEQWLEQPKWYIYVALDCAEAERIAEYILKKECIYIPYLGKNDHPADIADARILEGELLENDKVTQIDSLFLKEAVQIDLDDEDVIRPFKYEESLPVALDSRNLYCLKRFAFTNLPITSCESEVFGVSDSKIESENEPHTDDKVNYQITFH